MSVTKLLDSLRERGVMLSANGDRLAWEAPAGTMTPDLLAVLKAHKEEILAVLGEQWGDAVRALMHRIGDDEHRQHLADVFTERVGICTDSNVPLPTALRLAYEQAAAEAEALGMERGGQ